MCLTSIFQNMQEPGLDIRPIKQANGQSGFNAGYFTDVRIPDAQRLGPVGEGWKSSLTTLMNERLSIGSGMASGFPEPFPPAGRPGAPGGLAIEQPGAR